MSASKEFASDGEAEGVPSVLQLLPEDDAIFLPQPAAFTALYEPSHAASYSGRFASVNAGAFELYVGGGSINLGFAKALDAAGHRVDAYAAMHRLLYDRVHHLSEAAADADRKLVSWTEAFPPDELEGPRLARGVASSSVLLSSLEQNFMLAGTLAGTVFVDVFEDDLRPENNPNNRAMVYVIGPEGSLANDKADFLRACEYTGRNMAQALTEFNAAQETDTIEFVRVCLVSGGIFRHPATEKVDVAAAFIRGISQHYVSGTTPKLEFAYDEDVFQIAYKALADELNLKDKPEDAA